MGKPKMQKDGFPGAIRENSQCWVVLSCDAYSVSAGLGRIRQPCDRTSCEHFKNVRHFARETSNMGIVVGFDAVCFGILRLTLVLQFPLQPNRKGDDGPINL